MPSFRDIPQFPRAHYEVDVAWRYLEEHLANWAETRDGAGGMDLSPDYQRAHVWTREQQIAYVEYQLQGGEVGRNVVFNSPDWMRSWKRVTELVDGKQRLEAVRCFLRDEFPVFGHLFSEYTDKITNLLTFKFRVCSLETREEILQLYLNINAGGTPHTQDELDRVRVLLAEARGETTPPAKKPRTKKAAVKKDDSWLAAARDGTLQNDLAERSAKARGRKR
jgi:hypothetical protein